MPAFADPLRLAYFNTELQRDGPGLLLRDLQRGKDDQIAAVIDVLTATQPDIVVLQGIDWDLEGRAAAALQDRLSAAGLPLPHRFAAAQNGGRASGLDLNGNGRLGEAEDAHGYGEFTGQGGLLVLSRFPIAAAEVQDFTAFLWRDLPGALLPIPGIDPDITAQQRLPASAHWVVPVDTGGNGRLWLGTFAAAPPVFDGPEDRNGRRNHDEVAFWRHYLDGAFGPVPQGFVLAGNADQDPDQGDGRREAIRALLARPELRDPIGPGATVDWTDIDVGKLRVTYILPGPEWQVTASGTHWPDAGTPAGATAALASRHRLIWVDLMRR